MFTIVILKSKCCKIEEQLKVEIEDSLVQLLSLAWEPKFKDIFMIGHSLSKTINGFLYIF